MARREEVGVPLPTWQQAKEVVVGGESSEDIRVARKKKKKSREKRGRKNGDGEEQQAPAGTQNVRVGGNERTDGPKLRVRVVGTRAEDGVKVYASKKNPVIPLSPIESSNSLTQAEDAQKKKQKKSRGAKGARAKQRQIRHALKQVGPEISKLEGKELSAAFERARLHMGIASVQVKAEDMLLLYGLYKQISQGDVRGPQPPPTKFVSNQKYIAWKARKGTDKDTAMKLYIYNVKRIDPSFSWEEEQVGTDTQVDDDDDIEGFSRMKVQETPKAKREDFQRFLKSRALSTRYSAEFQANRLSNNIQVESHKSYISEYDVKRFTMIKIQKQSQSVRFSSIPEAKLASIHIPEVDPKEPYRLIKELILKITAGVKRQTSDRLTDDKFSGTEKPAIGLEDFIFRMVRYLDKWFNNKPGFGSVGVRSLLMSTVYLERIKDRVGDFALTEYNVHRLFAVCMLLAAKFSEDYIIANSYWAEVAGIEMKELNSIEENFCNLCGFDLYISDAKLKELYETYTADFLAPEV